MSFKPEDIKKVVLEEDDFGHEMRVGRILSNVKYPQPNFDRLHVAAPEHGGTYIDSITGKPRQFDFRCRITKQGSQNLFLAVECKNLNTSSPLVVCGRPRAHEESYHIIIAGQNEGLIQLKKVEGINSIFLPKAFVGKSVLRLKTRSNKLWADTDADIYEKWSQALASSVELATYAGSLSNGFSFIMPLVVVPDNSLWIANYKDDGTIDGDPTLTDQCDFYVDHEIKIGIVARLVITHIHFVTLKGLSRLLDDFTSEQTWMWDKLFSGASTNYP